MKNKSNRNPVFMTSSKTINTYPVMKTGLRLSVLLCVLLTACQNAPNKQIPVSYYGTKAMSSVNTIMVRRGDNMGVLARNYGVAEMALRQLNNLPQGQPIIGQQLKLPAPDGYQAEMGDTLNSLAYLFGISPTDMAQANGMLPGQKITAGQWLRIPNQQPVAVAQNNNVREPLAKPPEAPKKETMLTRWISRIPQKPAAAVPSKASAPLQTASIVPNKPLNIAPQPFTGFSWPVRGPLVSDYGAKAGGKVNDGINIAAPKGTPVRAAASGKVVFAGNFLESKGNLVIVRHPSGQMTAYAHMDKILVQRGEQIAGGQSIGTVGQTGDVASPQLHFQLREKGLAANPHKVLKG